MILLCSWHGNQRWCWLSGAFSKLIVFHTSGIDDALYKYATKAAGTKDSTVSANDWKEVLSAFHDAKVDDQFVPPIVVVGDDNKPRSVVQPNDIVIYYDYRTDRAKPLTAAFLDVPYGGQVGGLSVGRVDAHFQHRDQLHVAVRFVGCRVVVGCVGQIGEGAAVDVCHLALVVPARPVEHVEGEP